MTKKTVPVSELNEEYEAVCAARRKAYRKYTRLSKKERAVIEECRKAGQEYNEAVAKCLEVERSSRMCCSVATSLMVPAKENNEPSAYSLRSEFAPKNIVSNYHSHL